MNSRALALLIAAGVIVADQLTKWWVVAALADAPVVLVEDFLQLRYITNSGAAFSLLDGAGTLIALVAIAAAMFVFTIVSRVERRREIAALGLVLGGAIGNLIDRAFRGEGFLDGGVVDWIDFSFFPAFNVADSAITIGAGLALLFAFLEQ